ncbi:MAG: YdcH family protein [Sphingomonadaceae bacterium]
MDEAHRSALASKHAGLDRRIEEETQRPLPDSAVLSDLKKRKLRLKEELAGFDRD